MQQAAVESLLSLQTLDELTILDPILVNLPAISLPNLKTLSIILSYGVGFDPAIFAQVLAGCSSVTHLDLEAGRNCNGNLTDIAHVFPLSVEELRLCRFNLDCGLPETAWEQVQVVRLQSCTVSSKFWCSPTPSVMRLTIDPLDENTAKYLASSLSGSALKELIAQEEINPPAAEILFRDAMPRHGNRLTRLTLGSPYNQPFTAGSFMAQGLKHCENVETLTVSVSSESLESFPDEKDGQGESLPGYQGADSLVRRSISSLSQPPLNPRVV